MLRRLATLKAAKKNVGFDPSVIHKGVGTAGNPVWRVCPACFLVPKMIEIW